MELKLFSFRYIKILYCFIMTLFLSRTQSSSSDDQVYIMLKDNADYTIEETLGEEEYELIHNGPIKTYYNGSTSNSPGTEVYQKLNSTSLQSKNSAKRARTNNSNNTPLTTVAPTIKYWYYRKGKPKKYIYVNNGTDYNFFSYDDFVKKYVEEGRDGGKIRHSSNDNDTDNTELLRTIKSLFTFDSHCKNCTAEELKQIGLKSICCLALDYQRGEGPRVLAARLWRIVKIWMLLYLLIALPLWCMKGWCCCCLCCKFFKPRETIEEAKAYLLRNPPGVLTVRHKEVRYEPTENERDACEEFEHLLRTI